MTAHPTGRHTHTCPLCEATCGLVLDVAGDAVTAVRGDPDDVFSRGFACPKGLMIGDLHADPDRLRSPLVDGRTATWEQAWEAVGQRLRQVRDAHSNAALAVYLGNPNVHNLSGSLYAGAVIRALRTRKVFSASTSDQMPKQVAALMMFGDGLTIPIPDIDRTDLLVVLGADPLTSNGSLMTAPDMPGRLRALRRRGGRLVVVDPRTSRTARAADLHLAIRPGTDALLLAALAHVLLDEGLAAAPGPHITGVERLAPALARFPPEAVAAATGLQPDLVRGLARDLAAAGSAAVYGRIGTCTVRFGTVTSWLVDVVNTLTGNLDSPGGVMFPLAAAGQRNCSPTVTARAPNLGRFATVVRGLPEVMGELPSAALAEEIAAGHIRGLVTIAGNPALSAPDAGRLDAALAGLEVMISVDCYLNETSRHAHVVLPVPGVLERPHYDLAFTQLAVRNVAHWSPPVFAPAVPAEWQTLCRLASVAAGGPPEHQAVDDATLAALLGRHVAAAASPVAGRDVAELVARLNGMSSGETGPVTGEVTGGAADEVAGGPSRGRRGEERLLDALLRLGPYGEGFGARPDGLTLDRLAEHPHGLDLGALQPRLPDVLRTVSGRVELTPEPLLADLSRLAASLTEPLDGLRLVGRRHLRSNNSWGHNVAGLVGGSNVCTLQIHPDDAASRGIGPDGRAILASSVGSVEVQVEITDRIRPGVVSLPHGWGHAVDGVRLAVAGAHPGVNTNILTPPEVDPLSGTAVLNGFRVEVTAVP